MIVEHFTELLRQGYCMPLDDVREEGVSVLLATAAMLASMGLLVVGFLTLHVLSEVGLGRYELVVVLVDVLNVTLRGLVFVLLFGAFSIFMKQIAVEWMDYEF